MMIRKPLRRVTRGLFVALLIFCLSASVLWAAGTQRALLVGATEYPYLKQRFQLKGPANDVILMTRLLTERFQFDPQHIVQLIGRPEGSNSPTRQNIADAFARLAELSGPEDQIVILLAGHGSQLPADDDPEDLESDGWDETFLPADVRGWPGGSAEESIRDDDLRRWVGAIAETGAFVWLIADSCNSGTLLRGAPEQTRWVPAMELLGEEAVARVRGAGTGSAGSSRSGPQAGASSGRTRERDIIGLSMSAPNVVGTYAALPDQQTPEGTFRGIRQGLFTFTIVKVLEEASEPLTYRELADRVRSEYGLRQWPTPFVEGGGQDREVLGLEEWPPLSRFKLQRGPDRLLTIDAGDLQGISPGSVLAVYPQAGATGSHSAIGHVRAVSVEPLRTVVEPVAWAGLAAPTAKQLAAGSRCSLVYVDYGSERIKVAVRRERENPDGTVSVQPLATGKGPEAFEAAWSRLGEGKVRRLDDPAAAEWFVRLVGDELILGPVSGWPDAVPEFYRIGLRDDPVVLSSRLEAAFARVAKARHLLRVASGSSGAGSGGVRIELEATRLQGRGPKGKLSPGPAGLEVRPGDLVELEVRNASSSPGSGKQAPSLDVALFYIDAEHRITLLMPSTDFSAPDSRLKPGESQAVRVSISGEPSGREQVAVLAIPVKGAKVPDFSAWASGTTRGVKPEGPTQQEQLQDFAALLLAWQTLPSSVR